MNIHFLIIEKIKSFLSSILVTEGYLTNIGEYSLFYWQDTSFEYKEPAINICDYNETVKQENLMLDNEFSVKVSIIVPTEAINIQEFSGKIVSDLKQAFFSPQWGQPLSGIQLKTYIKEFFKNVETKGVRMLMVTMYLVVKYRENYNA